MTIPVQVEVEVPAPVAVIVASTPPIAVQVSPAPVISVVVGDKAGPRGPSGSSVTWLFRDVTTDTTAGLFDALRVDATAAPVAVTLPAPTSNGQVTVTKTDSSSYPVAVIGFDPLITQNQSVTFVADGTTWRILMAYTPGLGTVVAQIAALKQQAVSARVTQAGSATPISAAFGTQYEITGSTNQTINLPASSSLPATSTGVVVVKCGPSYSGTITVSPASGTIDGAASFTLVGGGQENLFEVGTSDADWQVG